MGSKRLPEKVMKPLADIPLVGHIYQRLVANWIKDNQERFKQLSIKSEYEADTYFHSCCIDTFNDYELLSKMFGELYLKDELFGWPLVRTWLLNSKNYIVRCTMNIYKNNEFSELAILGGSPFDLILCLHII